MIRLSAKESEEHWNAFLKQRRTECSICLSMGHALVQDHKYSDKKLYTASCGREQHSACATCIRALAPDQRKCSCLPFGGDACEGVFPTYKRKIFRAQKFAIKCPCCWKKMKVSSSLARGGGQASCPDCDHRFCVGCGLPGESCACDLALERLNPHSFSRYFRDSRGLPIRKRDLKDARVRQEVSRVLRLAAEQPCEESFPVECPSCGVKIARTSACHEMSHCGRKICWVSGRSTLPWEPCLPSWHWEQVPRWDYDCPVGSYVCREGHCYHDEAECNVEAHRPGRLEMAEYRKGLRLKLMQEEIAQALQD